MSNTYLTRTVGTPTNIDKYTFSVWVKRADIGAGNSKIFSVANGTYGEEKLEFNQDDLTWRQTLPSDGNIVWQKVTNKKFRDSSAWYHIVVAYDSTDGTAADRCKMYVNGVQETSFSGEANPASGTNSYTNTSGSTLYIGRLHNASSQFFGGLMSHMHYIDGTAYDASAFGQYDANGVWTIKTSPSVTYGTNGFFILKDGNSVTDQSGNSNNLTVAGGTLTNTEDNPSNVFATLNSLGSVQQGTLSEGNLTITSSSAYKIAPSTLAVSSGKWYVENKITGSSPDASVGVIDVQDYQTNSSINYAGDKTNSVGYYKDGRKIIANSFSSYGASYTENDIIGIALDLDSGTKTITFYKNGASQGAINLPTTGSEEWYFLPSPYNATIKVNFGNGYFGTTAVASAGTNASGNGIFEFDCPTGYTALSTKGLNL